MENYTIPRAVLTVVADATATYELTAAILRETRADVGADLPAVAAAAARAKGTVDMLKRIVEEMERTGDVPHVVGLVGGRLSSSPPNAVHAAYCHGAALAVAQVMSATGAVAA